LVDYYLKMTCKTQGLLLKNFSEKALQKLTQYDWPGNVEELKTCVERAVLYNPKSHIINESELENTAAPLFDNNRKKRIFGDMPFVNDHEIALKDRLSLIERELILSEIKRNNGNKSQAAKVMGISREALRKKLMMSDQILEELKLKNSNVIKYNFGKSVAIEQDDVKKAA
jgi:Nif-specific regulatory protein